MTFLDVPLPALSNEPAVKRFRLTSKKVLIANAKQQREQAGLRLADAEAHTYCSCFLRHAEDYATVLHVRHAMTKRALDETRMAYADLESEVWQRTSPIMELVCSQRHTASGAVLWSQASPQLRRSIQAALEAKGIVNLGQFN